MHWRGMTTVTDFISSPPRRRFSPPARFFGFVPFIIVLQCRQCEIEREELGYDIAIVFGYQPETETGI